MMLKLKSQGYAPVLIFSESIKMFFERRDLDLRQNAHRPFLDKYHSNWIIDDDYFLIPTFYLKGDSAVVGNGRHRITLLSKHTKLFPIAFEGYKNEPNESQINLYKKLVHCSLPQDYVYDFPDLEIEDLGEDVGKFRI